MTLFLVDSIQLLFICAAPPLDFVATSEFPDDPGPGVSSLFDADVQPAREAPGVYARGVHTAAAAEKQLSRLAGPPRCVPVPLYRQSHMMHGPHGVMPADSVMKLPRAMIGSGDTAMLQSAIGGAGGTP